MKHKNFSLALILLGVVLSSAAQAQDFDSLGSNKGVLNRAKSMSTQQNVRIVQKRAVDRDMRFEFGVGYGAVAGGNSYLSTQPLLGSADFHFTPRISIGARYAQYNNQLTREGQSQFEAARAAKAAGSLSYDVPEVDFPVSSILGTVSYYPIYGKLNFFDLTVVQFDLYVLGGYGQMQLKSGVSNTWTAGGGIGFWWTKYVSSRMEIRHQAYQDQVYTGKRDVGMIVGTIGLGILL